MDEMKKERWIPLKLAQGSAFVKDWQGILIKDGSSHMLIPNFSKDPYMVDGWFIPQINPT